jgi:sortase A
VSAVGLPPRAFGAIVECNDAPDEPVVSLAGLALVPVGCTNPLGDLHPTDGSGVLAPASLTVRTGVIGPPTAGTDSIGNNAAADAVKYPCPPTSAQAAAGVTCMIRAGVFTPASKRFDSIAVPISLTTGTGPTVAPPRGSSGPTGTSTPTVPNPAPGAGGGSDNGAIVGAAATALPPPQEPAVGQPVGLLSIPKIGINGTAIVQGVGESDLQQGPGHYPGTAMPGQPGNTAIAGHRTTYGAPFYNLDQLQPGDPITVQTTQGVLRYQVVKSHVVAPDDVSVLDPIPLPILTLTTCNPRYSASTRLVVVALLQKVVRTGATASDGPLTSSPSTTVPTPPSAPAHRALSSEIAAQSTGGSVGGAVVWGGATFVAAALVRSLWRRRRRLIRVGALVLGVPSVVASLFVFFEHVSVALPPNF